MVEREEEMKTRVAMISPWKVRCGIFSYTEKLSKALAELGVDVYIVRLPRFGMKTPGILQNVAESIPVDKVDIIVVSHEYGLYQNLEGGFYGSLKQLNKPIVTVLHAVGNWNVDKVICETSDRVVVHNEFCARRLGHPSVIIPHGCSPEQCVDSAEAKRSYGFKPEWPIVGYLGFISDYKNLEILVEAMAKVPEAGLLIGGGWHTGEDTPYIEELKRRSFEVLPNRVQWLGFVPDDALPRAYGCMDIVVYPPRFATESGALLMALGHGKATLASRLAPFREKERRGALETFTDAADLRRRVRRLLRDGDARKRLEAGAWQYAQDFSWSKIAELHLGLYDDVVSKL